MGQDRFISRTILVLAAIGCSGLLSACPYTDRHVNLAPPTMVPQISASPGSNGKGVISVARPLDLRPDPTVVGNVRDGYGRVGAQVRSNNDVPLWVTNSFITGLEQAGYRVERVETAETAQTPVAIDVTVSRVFVDYTPGLLGMSGTGDIATQVEVYKQGRRVLRRVYVGKHEGFNLLAAPAASEYQGLLDGAMKDLLQKAVPDLTNAVSRAFEDPVQK